VDVAVLLRATVVSMVPAAPLLPTTDPLRWPVAHRVVPAEVVVGPVEGLVVVDPWPDGLAADVVEVVEPDGRVAPDEQAASARPKTASVTARPTGTLIVALLVVVGLAG
jgi:hypothetical protein